MKMSNVKLEPANNLVKTHDNYTPVTQNHLNIKVYVTSLLREQSKEFVLEECRINRDESTGQH